MLVSDTIPRTQLLSAPAGQNPSARIFDYFQRHQQQLSCQIKAINGSRLGGNFLSDLNTETLIADAILHFDDKPSLAINDRTIRDFFDKRLRQGSNDSETRRFGRKNRLVGAMGTKGGEFLLDQGNDRSPKIFVSGRESDAQGDLERALHLPHTARIAQENGGAILASLEELTPRELTIFQKELQGIDRAQIAAEASIVPRTLTNLIIDIRGKLGIDLSQLRSMKTAHRLNDAEIDQVRTTRLFDFVFGQRKILGKGSRYETENQVQEVLDNLNKKTLVKERKSFVELYLKGYTAPEIGKQLDIEPYQVNRLQKYAARDLLEYFRELEHLNLPEAANIDKYKYLKFGSPSERKTFSLYLNGYSFSHISEQLGITTGSVASTVCRFRNKFKLSKDETKNIRFNIVKRQRESDQNLIIGRTLKLVFGPELQDTLKTYGNNKEGREALYKDLMYLMPEVSTPDSITPFELRVLGFSYNQIGHHLDRNKGTASTNTSKLATRLKNKFNEWKNANIPEAVDPLKWLSIQVAHRPIARQVLAKVPANEIFEKHKQKLGLDDIKQLYQITNAIRRKLGINILS